MTGADAAARVVGVAIPTWWLWRHPRAMGAAGRCIGRTDLAVDPRRAKRLAHRLRAQARRQGLPRVVWTSPLQRCAQVGRWLRRWGWTHRIDPRLRELDFGDWDGRAWASIPREAVDAWVSDFAVHRPGGGESLSDLLERLRGFVEAQRDAAPRLIVTHAGVMQALPWLARSGRPSAAQWPAPPRPSQGMRWTPPLPE